jgi:ribonuclease D
MQLITTSNDLLDLCQQLSKAHTIAIDTEFVRDKTYYPTLCLIQVACEDVCACIDPLTIEDLSPLAGLLSNTAILKVFHAARQDLEILLQELQVIPQPLFDTQLAATLLGLGEQIGYGNLVSHYLNVTLSKQHARADWEQRPLSSEQLEYAADDVRYLLQMFPLIIADLDHYGRRDWLDNDFAALSDPQLYQVSAENLWQRISGHQKLRRKQLAVLQQLCIWREQLAINKNKPRKWILADNIMLAIAIAAPQTKQKLSKIRGLNPSTLERNADQIVACVMTAINMPEEQWPEAFKRNKLTKNQEACIDALMAICKLKAEEHNISVGAIANRGDLETLLSNQADHHLSSGWRYKLVGDTLMQFLAGNLQLCVKENQIYLQGQ